ncbi:hypothetical protein Mapa_004124 [Marchantia paleacea]|nr:hypothetical protein Mapa_004124 [Marchantia paleacea]
MAPATDVQNFAQVGRPCTFVVVQQHSCGTRQLSACARVIPVLLTRTLMLLQTLRYSDSQHEAYMNLTTKLFSPYVLSKVLVVTHHTSRIPLPAPPELLLDRQQMMQQKMEVSIRTWLKQLRHGSASPLCPVPESARPLVRFF